MGVCGSKPWLDACSDCVVNSISGVWEASVGLSTGKPGKCGLIPRPLVSSGSASA